MENTDLQILDTTQAKQRASKIIESNKDCISYVRPEDLEIGSLFLPVVSVIKPTKDDFYDPIPGIGIMAKPPLVNLLKEKAGVNIIRTETAKRGEFIWTAHCFGEKRQSDGTMLTGDSGYEFDAEKRAELDAINQPQKYGSDVAKRKHLLETAKFGEQRAVTGAQFALIHKLAHVARSFKTPEELMRGMIVLRIDRNVDGILSDPQMRKQAIELAVGASDQIYGPPPRAALPDAMEIPADQVHEQQPAPPAEVDDDPFGEKAAAREKEAAQKEMDPKAAARLALEEWLLSDILKPSAKDVIRALLANPGATMEALQNMLDRCAAFEDRAKTKAAGRIA